VETLKEIRRQKGWSQKDLADESGVGQDTISGIESGRHEPRPSTLRKLAEALGVQVADFFREPTSPKVLRPRSLDELLERAGLETRWFTLPDEEFNSWWLGVDWKEASRRFWEINEEYRIINAEVSAGLQGETSVSPELRRQFMEIYPKAVGRHLYARAAAPGKDETEESFVERQRRRETRQFDKVNHGKPVEEVVARAS
jgi:transcriptional regulator with XRE-family HTH domain